MAEWLAKKYDLRAIPVHNLSSAPVSEDGEPILTEEGAVAFTVARSVPPKGDGSLSDGLELFGSADTFELAVARAVLVIEGVAFDPSEFIRY